MPVIYFDNFKGFNKTFLPLNNVNFFVGENSSGKTSVLKLIKVLSDQKFWFTQLFSSDEADLGYYREIANISSNKKYFEIAILGNEDDKKSNISAVKLKFIEKEGVPFLKEMSLIAYNHNIQAIVEDGYIKYRFEKVNISNITDLNKIKYFKIWVEKNTLSKKKFLKSEDSESFLFKGALILYIQSVIAEISREKRKTKFSLELPNFLKDVAWLAPIRTEPKRTYDSHKLNFNPDGAHAPYLLKKLLEDSSKKNHYSSIIQRFGLDSGLFEKINITSLGKEQTSPFELEIVLNNNKLKITNVGYGVSQVLPIIIEIIARQKGTWFAIQQPEIHLHPRGQAAFGDFILKSAIKENKNFIIETHSDFTIDRFRLKLNKINNKEEIKDLQSQIVFFHKKDGKNNLFCIPINNDGTLSNNQPIEFRDFFVREQIDLLTI